MPIAPPSQKAPPCRQLGEAVHCEGRAERDAERSLLGERGADAEARGERLSGPLALPGAVRVASGGATELVGDRVVVVDADTEPERVKEGESESCAEGVPPWGWAVGKGAQERSGGRLAVEGVGARERLPRAVAEFEPPRGWSVGKGSREAPWATRLPGEAVPRCRAPAEAVGATDADGAPAVAVAASDVDTVAEGVLLRDANTEREPEGQGVEEGEGGGERDAESAPEVEPDAVGGFDMVSSRVVVTLGGGEREADAAVEAEPRMGLNWAVGKGSQEPSTLPGVPVRGTVTEKEGLRDSRGEGVSLREAGGDALTAGEREGDTDVGGDTDAEGLRDPRGEGEGDGDSEESGVSVPRTNWAVGKGSHEPSTLAGVGVSAPEAERVTRAGDAEAEPESLREGGGDPDAEGETLPRTVTEPEAEDEGDRDGARETAPDGERLAVKLDEGEARGESEALRDAAAEGLTVKLGDAVAAAVPAGDAETAPGVRVAADDALPKGSRVCMKVGST